MKILIAYYSRSGHTDTLARVLRQRFESRGHSVVLERIAAVQEPGRWQLVPPLWSAIPLLPLILWVPPFRRWWFKHYHQPELAIHPLDYPDVSGFDRVCIGGPKWLYIAYPLARYLNTVTGLSGKKVGAFATFCGPPLKVFELEMLFTPIEHRVRAHGAFLAATLATSSHFHEFFFFREMEQVFRLVSHLFFRRSLRSFAQDSPWGCREVEKFCAALSADNSEKPTARAGGKGCD